jgi:hypothetical protein
VFYHSHDVVALLSGGLDCRIGYAEWKASADDGALNISPEFQDWQLNFFYHESKKRRTEKNFLVLSKA